MRITKSNDAIIAKYKVKAGRGVEIHIQYNTGVKSDYTIIYYYKGNNNARSCAYDKANEKLTAFDGGNFLSDAEYEEILKVAKMFRDACDALSVAELQKASIVYKLFYNQFKELAGVDLKTNDNMNDLTTLLFNKYIVKCKYCKQIQYQYNYSDKQTLTAIYNNGCRDVWHNIPTTTGTLALYMLQK